jgi:AraC-like DNA-binding protein
MVDFRAVECRAGTVLTLHPGQVQRYDAATGWHGWLVLFRPEFLQSQEAPVGREDLAIFRRLDALPAHMQLDELERDAVVEGITRMFSDAQLKAGAGDVQALLRSELHATIIRLRLVQARRGAAKVDPPALVKRFRLYSLAVEEHFQTRHAVANYARLLGCSQKSLGRAVQRIAGVSAKAFLSQRIALEAKRLLVHTALPVATIAHRLGFDEPTNFVKFFRREARKAPGAFRSQYKSRSPSNTNARQPTI